MGAALAVSSSGRFGNGLGKQDEYLGDGYVWVGLVLATLAYTALVALVWALVSRLSERQAAVVLGLVVGVAVLAFLVVYPRFGAPTDSSGYGDADDALDILADSLTDGFDPYDGRTTYLGGNQQPSPMMGAGVLALPFRVAFGSAAYQNPAWFMIAVLALLRRFGARVTLAITVPVLSSLGFAEHYLLGGDFFIGGVVAALAAFAFLAALERGAWLQYGAAVFLALATANRATTLPVLALVAAVLFAHRRLTSAMGPLTVAVVGNLALWLPWWVRHGDGFHPIERVGLEFPPVGQAFAVILLLGTLAFVAAGRWIRRTTDPSPTDRLSRQGGLLALTGLPLLVWAPQNAFRAVTYLWLSVPLLALLLVERFDPVAADPEDG